MDLPDWYRHAIAAEYEVRDVQVDGTRIAYRAWGTHDKPLIALVHGGAANSAWWDHVGPHLANDHRVVALDLAGHGDSDWAAHYSLERWADQLMAVAHAESDHPPAVFGHSLGGFVTLTAAKKYGRALAGALAIDSPVRALSAEQRAWRDEQRASIGPNKVHPAAQDLVERFRTLPDDVTTLPYVRRHIAENSIKKVEGGFTWKFDRRVFFSAGLEPDDLVTAECPVALIRGERGMATSDITADIAARLGDHVPVTVIPDAGHHIMLDQPIALIAVLQTLAGQWLRDK